MQLNSHSQTEPVTTIDNKPLSIAFVVDRFGARYGGAEAYGVELMRVFTANGHKVTVFARSYDTDCDLKLDFQKITIAKFWPSWLRVLFFARQAAKATKNKFDIVHSHMNGWCGDIEVIHVTPVRYRWRVQTTNKIKKILNSLSPRIRTYLWLESRRVAPHPGHKVVAVSQLIAEQLHRAYKLGVAYPVIPPGVQAAAPIDAIEKENLRIKLKLPLDAKICLLVARNPIRKGLATALKAINLLPEDVHLLVVGANLASKNLLTKEGTSVQQKVHMVPETSNVVPYYQVADIYIHPTLNDSFGMAPLEAMSFGLPVILSPAPWCGFADYVQANTEALLLKDPKDYQDLAGLINHINNSDKLKNQLIIGSAAVVKRHSWEEVASDYMDLYQEILADEK